MDINDIRQIESNFKAHNYAFFINTKIESAHTLYTNPLGIFNDNPDEKVDIQSRLVDAIGKEECRSFVVFGDAGSGKTSLALHLCNEYWKRISVRSAEEVYVPLYISLRQIELQKDCKNILSTFCESSPGNVKATNLSNWNLLLFLDGYDELDEKINLWEHNNWWLPGRSKKIKTVTFCKSIGLKVSERERCFTFGHNEKSTIISIQAFESDQIDDYLRKTVAFLRSISIDDANFKDDPWFMTKNVTKTFVAWEVDTAEYEKWFKRTFPDLKQLAGNPYLLTIILQILPGIVENCRQPENGLSVNEQEKAIRVRCSTEIGIYDEFVAQWFLYQAIKNRKTKSSLEFVEIPVEHISGFMLAYAQNLAFTLVQKNGGFLSDGSVSEEDCNLWHLWKPIHNKDLLDLVDTEPKYLKLFPTDRHDNDNGRMCNLKSLRNACFLSNPTPGTFKFFHLSLVEYLASREVFENVRGRFNFYLNSDDPIYDNEFGINASDLTDTVYYPLLTNLAQRAQTNESFKNLLFDIIDKSSEILILSRMSANAIAILNFAGISLSGRSFRNVQIAGANLSGSNFANSDFRFANLAGVKLQQSWMVGCKFQGANFDKIDFGQDCSVQLGGDNVTGLFPYIKDGKSNLVIGYESGKVHNYTFSTEILREIIFRTNEDKHFLHIEGSVLLTHTLSRNRRFMNVSRYDFLPSATTLTVNVWNLDRNEQMDSIVVDNPNPLLIPTQYWISKDFLELDEVARLNRKRQKSYSVPSTSSASIDDHKSLSEEEIFSHIIQQKETFHYYEIKSCQRGNVGLVILWGYVVSKKVVTKYREPQILKTFASTSNEGDQILFRLYSDFPIFGCDIHVNKLVALKGADFVAIFSIFPTTKLTFKDNFRRDSDYEDIKFSSDGHYLIYKNDFVCLCIINDVEVESIVKILEVDSKIRTKFFVVFDKSCEMTAFAYRDTIFICKLPAGTIIKKMQSYNRLLWPLFPTFAFIDQTAEGNSKLFCYVTDKSDQKSLETITISEASNSISQQRINERVKFFVSNDNQRVATFYTFSRKSGETKILSVFSTPITSQSLLFQTEIQSSICGMLFTPNYLLVVVTTEVLVLDMNGNFYQSIKFPLSELRLTLGGTTFISSKYQQIVLCYTEITNEKTFEDEFKSTLQLCNIVERLTDNCRMAPVAFENRNKKFCSLNARVNDLTFDSRDGCHILLENRSDWSNIWLWITATNNCIKISRAGLSYYMSISGINNFFMLHDGNENRICAANSSGYYFLNISSENSVKSHECIFHSYNQRYTNMSRFYLNVNWHVYANMDGRLYISYLKNDECLAEFLFPHRVDDFNLHFNYNSRGDTLESVDILSWDVYGNISSLLIDAINLKVANDPPTPNMFDKWKLTWTVKSHLVLNFQNSIIAKTFKVNESNKRLLKNFNVNLDVGEPWPEKIEYFSLAQLYMPVTEVDTKFAIINTASYSRGPRMPIMAENWVVSAVARNLKSNCDNVIHIEHVGLLLEGINNGRHFIMEAELTANKTKDYVTIKLVPVCTIERLEELKTDYIARQWMRPKSDVQMLIQSIQNDQLVESRKYNLLRNNCVTWCFEKLKEISIKRDRKKWHRIIFGADLPTDLFSIEGRIVKNRLPFNPSKSA